MEEYGYTANLLCHFVSYYSIYKQKYYDTYMYMYFS